jgi:hypothetical protein
MNTQVLPLTINVNKKIVYRLIAFYWLLILLSIWIIWEGSGHFFTQNYYYPKLIVLGPAATTFLLILQFGQIKILKLTNGFAKISDSGIEFFEDKYSGIGLVPWNALKGYSEEKKILCIYAKKPETYLNKISNVKTRKKVIQKSIGNSLLFSLNLTVIDYDDVQLKKILLKKIEENNLETTPV